MRAIWIRKHGGPDVLEVRETDDPEVTDGAVRVRSRAAGLNFAEVSARQGIYPPAPKPPCVVGYEGAGEIDAVGAGVDDLAVGDRVMFISQFGAHSDCVVVPRHQVAKIPDALGFEDEAAMPVNHLTAYQMLFRVRRLIAGERVLIHAAAGGVGTAVLQLCQTVDDVTTYGTASARKHDYVREQGCDHPIDYRSEDYAERVRALTDGEGVDLVCDALGGADWKKGFELLRPGGTLICFGLANASRAGKRSLLRLAGQLIRMPRFSPLDLMGNNRIVAGVDLGSLWDEHAMIQDGLERVVGYWEAGQARPQIDATFGFDQASEAFERLETGQNMGKIVLIP